MGPAAENGPVQLFSTGGKPHGKYGITFDARYAMKYKLFGFLTLIGILTFFSFSQVEREKAYIYWNQRPLAWTDFKGFAPASSPYVALTHSAIVLNYGGEGSSISFSVESAFYPKKSWKKKNVDDYILKHEQGHFDITELYARMLRKEIQELKFKTYETIGSDVQKVFIKNSAACDKTQDAYDLETDHSKKKEQQTAWDQKIETLLDSLADWSTPDFVMDVSYLLE